MYRRMASAVPGQQPGHVLREAGALHHHQGRARESANTFWCDEMIETADHNVCRPVTDGEIAVVNLENARRRSWDRLARDPLGAGTAERVIEEEQMTLQFMGDVGALDRLEALGNYLGQLDAASARTALVQAQVASTAHRFAEARAGVAQARLRGAESDAIDRLMLGIDQATGDNLPSVLAARRERAARPGRWDERIPLGALLADLGEFAEAETTYLDALREYPNVSPFAPAWVCFQLGALWGESVPTPLADRAAHWYRNAIDVLPCYVKARVHLAEICLDRGDVAAARALLTPVLECGEPEVAWRLADVAH